MRGWAIASVLFVLASGAVRGESRTEQLRVAIERVIALPTQELRRWLAEELQLGKNQQDARLLQWIAVDRLSGEAPEAAIKIAVNHHFQARMLMERWVKEDVDKAERYLLSLRDWRQLGAIWPPVIQFLAEEDPERSLKTFDRLIPYLATPGGGQPVSFRSLAEKTPDQLLEAAKKWPPEWRDCARVAVVGSWLRVDMAQGLKKIPRIPSGLRELRATLHQNRNLGAKMVPHLKSLPITWRRSLCDRGNAAALYGVRDLVLINPVAWLRADPDELGVDGKWLQALKAAAANAIQKAHHEAAVDVLPTLDKETQTELLDRLVTAWFSEGTETATRNIESLKAENLRHHARVVLRSLQKRDDYVPPEELSPDELMTALSAPDASPWVGVMRKWNNEDGTDALRAFRKLGKPGQAVVAKRLTADGMSEIPPALRGEAWRVQLEATPDDSRRTLFVARHAIRWARYDCAAAAEWARSMPRGEVRKDIFKLVVRVWAEEAPDELSQWSTILNEPDREVVRSLLGE